MFDLLVFGMASADSESVVAVDDPATLTLLGALAALSIAGGSGALWKGR